ncbi:hypothetical protein VRC12_12190 [Pseudomonas poae]
MPGLQRRAHRRPGRQPAGRQQRHIVNQSGGVIAGRDVTLTAVKGDVINERSLTGLGMGEDNRSYFGDAARVEAANDLTIKAGRDFTNSGSVLKSGGIR